MALAWAVGPIALGTYNWTCFGAPWRTGYAFQVSFPWAHHFGWMFSGSWVAGLLVLVFGRGHVLGLLTHTPIAVVGLGGWLALRRKGRFWALALVGTVLVSVLVISKYRSVSGGEIGTDDYRYLVHLLPLAMVGLGLLWPRCARRGRWAVLAVGAYSAFWVFRAAVPGSGYGDPLREAAALWRASALDAVVTVLLSPRYWLLVLALVLSAWGGYNIVVGGGSQERGDAAP